MKMATSTTWFEGRITLYPSLGLMMTDDKCVEFSPAQMVVVQTLLDAKGDFVPREAICAALTLRGAGSDNDNLASVHVTHIRDRIEAAQMPVDVVARHGSGLAMTWKGSSVEKRRKESHKIAGQPRTIDDRAKQAAICVATKGASIPIETQAEIKRLRNLGGKDRGGSVTWIAKRLNLSAADVATVLGVTWGRAGV